MNRHYFFAFILTTLSIFRLSAQSISDSLHVAHYDITISILDFEEKSVEGAALLSIVPLLPDLQNITVDLAVFDVDSVRLNQQSVNFQRLSEKISITLPSPLIQGDTLTLEVFYRGIPERDPRWGGFYFSGEYAFNMGVAMTRIPHNYGRCWYPCLDVFTDKSTYSFHVTTSPEKMAVCSGIFSDTTHTHNGNITWHWALNQPVPTYLTSVAVGEYAHYSDTYHGVERDIPIDIYVPQNRFSQVNGSFENLKAILRYFENSFGVYQFDRIGYVGVNFNSGAMEHATNIAYPNAAIDGTLNNESLLIHELSHSWFGNLMTCEKAEEMWINEGFARYCEILAEEFLYNTDGENSRAKQTYRELHRSTLKDAHRYDGGYFALNAIPQSVTYGSTTYDKGALIVHNLRHYLGDQQFYTLMREMIEEYAFQNISSADFFHFLTVKSGLPLNDFLQAWIAQPGLLHFSIDSITRNGNSNDYQVYIKQKLHHAHYFGNNQKIELTFFSDSQEEMTTSVTVSGENDCITVTIPFFPAFGIVDFHEKMSDATVDYQEELTTTGVLNFPEAYSRIDIQRIERPTFFRMEHHVVAPDPLQSPNEEIYRISNNHYWRVLYFPEDDFEVELQFKYGTGGNYALDVELFQGYELNDLVLLYRKDASEDWRIVHFDRTGATTIGGYIIPKNARTGEYCLAMGNSALEIKELKGNNLIIKPNPSEEYIEYSISGNFTAKTMEIIDMTGKSMYKTTLNENSGKIDIHFLSSGNYIICFANGKEKVSAKFVKN